MKSSYPDHCELATDSPRRPLGVLFLLTLSLMLVAGPRVYGQVSRDDLTDSNMTDAERRESTLLWLNKFLTESDLLRQSDVDKIRQAVAQMSPSQLNRWLEQTKQLREYVESPKWQATKRWLREFMRVQNIYSAEEIQKLRDEIVRADADQMLAILKRIQAKYDSLVWMQQASERNRQMEVVARDDRLAAQDAATAAARATPAASPPLFGNAGGSGGVQKPSTGYQVPSPLITSREMARAAVWSELWGPGWLVGF